MAPPERRHTAKTVAPSLIIINERYGVVRDRGDRHPSDRGRHTDGATRGRPGGSVTPGTRISEADGQRPLPTSARTRRDGWAGAAADDLARQPA